MTVIWKHDIRKLLDYFESSLSIEDIGADFGRKTAGVVRRARIEDSQVKHRCEECLASIQERKGYSSGKVLFRLKQLPYET